MVVFDLGKVLLDFDYGIACRKIAARGRVTVEAVRRYIDQSALLLRYEKGLLTSADFFREAVAATGFAGDFTEFADTFADIFSAIEPMVQLHADLRARGVPTFIFSNTNELAIRHVRRRFPFFHQFDGYILSYEHGAMKPEAALYEVVERTTGKSGAEILYLDDRPENVEAGRARGWQVILQEDPAKTIAAVKASGLLG